MQLDVPGYVLGKKVYHSSRSLVYYATREEDQERVVIKVLDEEYPSSQAIAHFQKEYEITHKLQIEGVIKVFELKRIGNTYALIMEDYGGLSLAHQFDEPAPMDTFFKLALQLTRTLGLVHEQNIIHKDINPGNLLWNSKTEEIRIIDFGISSELREESLEVTETLKGSPPYLSPEQTGRMNRTVDYRADYYSLGVTFYQLLTGQLPFHADDTMGWVHAHITRTPTSPDAINSDIPEMLARLVLKLMSKNAEDRYQSSRGLLLDLEKIRHQIKQTEETRDFTLGQWDVAESFRMPQKLYGRAEEITTLLNAFDEVSHGYSALMLVAGYAGVGKSALINEVHKPIVSRHGYFIEGKFDQFHQNVPYSAVAQAFRGLIRQILAEPPERLARWRRRLLEAFGPNGRIITELIPEIERIVGPQKEVEALNPAEAQNRFLLLFRKFLKIFARQEHPLVLFLDDLHWSDAASLTLIENIMTSKDIGAFFLIGAYRNNEAGAGHMLMVTIDEIQKHKPIYRLFLKPLCLEAVNEAISETLHCDSERSKSLAEMVFRKTEGNPFYVKEVLKNMHREGLLKFIHEEGRWGWESEHVDKVSLSENVVRFMVKRLQQLPAETIEALRLASCIGSSFDLKSLSMILESSPAQTAKILWEAVKQGVIVPLSDRYRLLHHYQEQEDFGAAYKFQHDQVQQAAYALIEENKRQQTHLSIGRLMLNHVSQDTSEKELIEIVRHLNHGLDLIEDAFERYELAQLNLKAGLSAMNTTAYQPAFKYFMAGIKCLEANSWSTQYTLTYSLYKECAQCAYLCRNFDRAEHLSRTLMQYAHSDSEKAEIHRIHLLQYAVLGKLDDAVRAGIEGLGLLDINIPIKPSMVVVLKESFFTRWNLGRRGVDELENLPPMIDPAVRVAVKILTELIPPAYLTGNERLMALCILKLVNLTYRHGHSVESAPAFAAYGAILSSIFGDLESGYAYGRLAIRLLERFPSLDAKCRTLFIYGLFIHSWNEPWRSLLPYFRESMEAGYQSGDLMYTGYACIQLSIWDTELSVSETIDSSQKYLPMIHSIKNQEAWYIAKISMQFHVNLRGETDERHSLSDPSFDEAQCLVKMTRNRFLTGVALFHISKLQLFYFYGDDHAAANHAHEVEKVAAAIIGQPSSVEYSLFHMLTVVRLYPEMGSSERNQATKRMRRELRRMKKWADHCPDNFRHHLLLMEAEFANVNGNPEPRLYDQAIASAHESGFLRFEALANELAAAHYYRNSREKIATVYLREAHYLYQRWGATSKVKDMETRYPWLLEQSERETEGSDDAITTVPKTITDTKGKDLDLASVAKAVQTLSDEVVLERLLIKLMDILRESASAQRAFLLLAGKEGRLFIQAESIDHRDVQVMQSTPLGEHEGLCHGVVQYVNRSHETVVLGDAANTGDFTMDPYIRERQPKSIMAQPIMKAGKLLGILYLENNIATKVFTTSRVEVLNVIAGKAAISIENAQLYHDLERRVQERTVQLESAQKELLEAAHQSGMAEIAAGVLHNVGNILSSINTSVDLGLGHLDKSRLPSLLRANDLMETHRHDLDDFLTNDPKGKQLPDFYLKLGEMLPAEHKKLREELIKIQECANLIKDVIGAQQEYAKAGLYTIEVDISAVIEDSLSFQKSAIERNHIQVLKKYEDTPALRVQKSKFIHILTNIFKNAVEALHGNDPEDRTITIEVFQIPREAVYIKIRDNGEGIPSDRLKQIFNHGFTTKKDGHGFGLHTCANYMADMGGQLNAYSDGVGCGAIFTLIYPLDGN